MQSPFVFDDKFPSSNKQAIDLLWSSLLDCQKTDAAVGNYAAIFSLIRLITPLTHLATSSGIVIEHWSLGLDMTCPSIQGGCQEQGKSLQAKLWIRVSNRQRRRHLCGDFEDKYSRSKSQMCLFMCLERSLSAFLSMSCTIGRHAFRLNNWFWSHYPRITYIVVYALRIASVNFGSTQRLWHLWFWYIW